MSSSNFIFLLSLFSLLLTLTQQQQLDPPPLNSAESELVYLALESISPETPWRTLYPDDLCLSSPHGVVCSYFSPSQPSNHTILLIPHVTELNFGYVSDASPNPACSSRATFPLTSLSSFPHLRKLLFYRCFTHSPVSLPSLDRLITASVSEFEELVLMENPALSGSINGSFGNFTSLRRFILTGSNVSGGIPDEITELPSVEQLTISGNKNLGKVIPVNVGKMKKLKILDLSSNGLDGVIPDTLGQNRNLIKLDLSYNNITGRIPENLRNLKSLEFLDLGYNKFGNFGVPLFLGELQKLKEVYLSGNSLGGVIPEIWENLGGILGIGLSGVGLVGKIPSSIGVYLRNASHILLDNNKLSGTVPKELELLEKVNEVNLRNNQLSGRIPFSIEFASRVGKKLKVEGNLGLCVDKSMKWSLSVDRIGIGIGIGIGSGLRNLKICNCSTNDGISNSNSALFVSGNSMRLCGWMIVLVLMGVFW